MSTMRTVMSVSLVVAAATFIATWLAAESRAQTPEHALAGAWTLNTEASDQTPAPGDERDGGDRRGGNGRYGGGGGGRHGGFGGGGRGGYGGGRGGSGGGGNGGANVDPEQMARMRDAMRQLMNPPEHLTITQTDTMVVITEPDGHTTRLSPDGKKVKDENTNIERKTKWDGGKLVSEINGLGRGKVTQTYAVDPEHHELRIAVQMENGRGGQPRTITHVYEADR
jgi:hypothetical protein